MISAITSSWRLQNAFRPNCNGVDKRIHMLYGLNIGFTYTTVASRHRHKDLADSLSCTIKLLSKHQTGWLIALLQLHYMLLHYVYLHMISNFHTCLFSYTVHVKGQDAPHKWQQCIVTERNNQLGPHRRSTKSIFASTNIHKFYYVIVSCSKWDYYSVHRHFWIRTQRTQRTKWITLSTENTCYIEHKQGPWRISTCLTHKITMVH